MFNVGDLVIKKYVSDSKPTLVIETSKDYDGWWVKTEQDPLTWVRSTVYELVSKALKEVENE